jgi:hypothetical protein
MAMPTGEIFNPQIYYRHPPPTVHANKPWPVAAIVAEGPIERDFLGYLLSPVLIFNGYLTSGFYPMLFVQLPHIKPGVVFDYAFLIPSNPATWTAHLFFPKSLMIYVPYFCFILIYHIDNVNFYT